MDRLAALNTGVLSVADRRTITSLRLVESRVVS